MAANTDPIFTRQPQLSVTGTTMGPTLTAAATGDYEGTNANVALAFTADATEGGFLQALRFKAKGTNIATVCRVYLNNGSDNTVAANNVLIEEVGLPATTASATAATATVSKLLNLPMPPGFRVYVGLGTAVAAGWDVCPIGGKY